MHKSHPLDADLDRYSITARTVLNLKKPAKRLGELALYTAAAGSALALAPSAEASIIYSGVQNVTLHQPSAFGGQARAPADLDENGVDDITLLMSYLHLGRSANTFAKVIVAGSQSVSFFDTNFFDLQKLAASTADIGASKTGSFSYSGKLRVDRTVGGRVVQSNGQFTPGPGATTTGFAGFRFKTDNAPDDHFGWLHLKVDVGANGRTDEITLIDWAYQSIAGESIHVGDTGPVDVPEPSGLALMALGALGIAALRRRRSREKSDSEYAE